MSQALQAQSAKLSAASLRDAIRQGESAAIEFKSSFQKEVVETLTAFANTQGGAVLMGISDAGQIVGVTVQAKTTSPASSRTLSWCRLKAKLLPSSPSSKTALPAATH